jgi:hypothetical protein
MVTRREVVSALACVSGLTTLGIPVAAAQASGRRPDLRLQKGEKLVMIGDSITDVGRARPIGEGRADDALAGLAGKTQTYLPWDSWQKPYVERQPTVWFHEIFKQDGTPYAPEEVNLIRKLTGR